MRRRAGRVRSWLAAGLIAVGGAVAAQVTLQPDASVVALAEGRVELALSGVAPWRLRLLDDPPRLALDVEGLAPAPVEGAGWERAEDGWTRMIVALPERMAVTAAALDAEFGRLSVSLEPDPSAVPADPDALADDPFLVAVDAGHGGRDPGAEREGLRESDLMLALAQDLVAALSARGIAASLTREGDEFVALDARVARAQAMGADVLVSLHADALVADEARGLSVYTLSADSAADATDRLVTRQDAGALLQDGSLAGEGDAVAAALLDLARAETAPDAQALADAILARANDADLALAPRPHREAGLAVLSSASIPGVLVETGFLSNDADRARLATPEGRAALVAVLADAIAGWEARL